MTIASKRAPNGGFFSRRNKCLVVTLMTTVGILVLFINAGIFTPTPVYTGELCKLDEIRVQRSFNKEKFAGEWHASYTKGSNNPLLSSLLEFTDVKMTFDINSENNYEVKSVGGKFLGMWCPVGEGHMVSSDADYPQKFTVFFDTPTGKRFGRKQAWLLSTDYTSYALLYSCWEKTDDNRCKADGAYAGIITRNTAPLPEARMTELRGLIAGACINPDALKKIRHEGYCKKERQTMSEG